MIDNLSFFLGMILGIAAGGIGGSLMVAICVAASSADKGNAGARRPGG